MRFLLKNNIHIKKLYYLLFSIVLLVSCSTLEDASVTDSGSSSKDITKYDQFVDTEKVQQFDRLSFYEKKISYQSLSKYDKLFFWRKHTKEFIESGKLNSLQKDAINELLAKASSPEIFVLASNDNTSFRKYINEWASKYISRFPNTIEARGFATLEPISQQNSGSLKIAVACDCGTNSVVLSDCNGDKKCLIPPAPGCVEADERPDGHGCGFWWLDTCNAKCS